MAINDQASSNEGKNLEGLLEKGAASGDYSALHNRLLQDSQVLDKDSFNKVMKSFSDANASSRQAQSGDSLPTVEIHNDFFGMGNTDQVVVKQADGVKAEVYENANHRQAEVNEANKQSQPNQFDLGREFGKLTSGQNWLNSRPDFQTDSAVKWNQFGTALNNNANPGARVTYQAGPNDGVGALPLGDASRGDLEYRLSHPPAGFNNNKTYRTVDY